MVLMTKFFTNLMWYCLIDYIIRHMQAALLVCRNRHRNTHILMRTERVVTAHISIIKGGKPEVQVLWDYVKSQVLLIDEEDKEEEKAAFAAAAAAAIEAEAEGGAGGGVAAKSSSGDASPTAHRQVSASSDAHLRRMLALRTAKRIEACVTCFRFYYDWIID